MIKYLSNDKFDYVDVIKVMSGIVLGAIVSSLVQDRITGNEVLLTGTTVLICILSACSYKSSHKKCMNHLLSQKKPIVSYKEEIVYDGNNVIDENGYSDIADYIEKAKKRILQVTSAATDNMEEQEFISRKKYFEILEKKVMENRNNPAFEYVRIHQVANEYEPIKLHDETTKKFYKRILEIKNDRHNTKAMIGLHKVKNNRSYGFTLIDDKYLIIQMSGYKNQSGQSAPGASGVFIFEDNHFNDDDSIVKCFNKYYNDVIKNNSVLLIESAEIS